MSAFICSHEHINVIATFADDATRDRSRGIRWPLKVEAALALAGVPRGKCSAHEAIAHMLRAENVVSVATRYSDCKADELPGESDTPFVPRRLPAPGATLVEQLARMHRFVACFMYQACEHDGWTDSAARALCATLHDYIGGKLADEILKAQGVTLCWEYEVPA